MDNDVIVGNDDNVRKIAKQLKIEEKEEQPLAPAMRH